MKPLSLANQGAARRHSRASLAELVGQLEAEVAWRCGLQGGNTNLIRHSSTALKIALVTQIVDAICTAGKVSIALERLLNNRITILQLAGDRQAALTGLADVSEKIDFEIIAGEPQDTCRQTPSVFVE